MADTTYLLEHYVFTKAGEPFRLFKFGKLVKDGAVRIITKELAARFKLPHFKPPIKRGSHDDAAPAGGHIVALEVRDDGLWAMPEYNEQGLLAIENGDYRYHSPEVIWDGWLENPETGEKIEGPLIVGDALLHTPHLGEAAALYSVEVIDGGNDMTVQDEKVSLGLLGQLFDLFSKQEPQLPDDTEPTPPDPTEDYQAQYETAQTQVEQLTAQVADFEAAGKQKERLDHFAAEFSEVEAVAENVDLFGILAEVTEEQAEQLMVIIKAIAEQARVANLTQDVGDTGADIEGDPTATFDAAVKKVMGDKEVGYNAAMGIVRDEQADVFNAYLEVR